jgi:uncharacterized membrane protein YbhN (UPF0104 family)
MLRRIQRVSRLWPILASALIIAALAYGARNLDLNAIILKLKTGEPEYLLVALGLVLANLFLRTLRLSALLSRPLLSLLPLQMLSLLYGAVTPAKLGEAVKIAGLRNRHQLRGSDGFFTLVCERFLEIAALALLALPVFFNLIFPIAGEGVPGPFFRSLLMGIFVAGIFGLCFRHWRSASLFGIRPARLFENFSWPSISLSLLVSLLVWSVEGLIFSLCLIAFDPAAWTPYIFCILPAALLVGSISGLPSGIGAFDISLVSLLSQTGAATASVVAALLVYRVLSACLPIAAGLSCLPWQAHILGKLPREEPAPIQ